VVDGGAIAAGVLFIVKLVAVIGAIAFLASLVPKS
jgi:hypothetical protein